MGVERCCFGINGGGADIEKKGGRAKSFCPEFWGQRGLNEEGANYIV